ncbi:MAG TPA: protein-export chaperone SecB [Gemmatimonadales bacterium]|jgi:preprotein translocase subunit SecB|nr:protein-export chaperone SecB [Gemmatimonadales bacterium]
MTDERKQPGIRVSQIYLESATFRHRSDHLSLSPRTPPEVGPIGFEVETGVSEDKTRALVRVRVMTPPDSTALYAFDLTMIALLRTRDEPNMPLEQYVSVHGTTLLFPFIREAVANLTTRGRFGPIWIAPFNVKAALEPGEPETEQKQLPRKTPARTTKKRAKKAGRT